MPFINTSKAYTYVCFQERTTDQQLLYNIVTHHSPVSFESLLVDPAPLDSGSFLTFDLTFADDTLFFLASLGLGSSSAAAPVLVGVAPVEEGVALPVIAAVGVEGVGLSMSMASSCVAAVSQSVVGGIVMVRVGVKFGHACISTSQR